MNRITTIALATLAAALPGHAWASSAACQARARSPVQVDACLQQEFTRQDARLNRSYQQVMATSRAREKTTLRGAQRQWITRRDARCESRDGTIDVNCMIAMTEARADVLQARLR